MPNDLALVVALAAPTLALVLLRINAALVFLSLCLGAVLVQYVAGEANSLITLFSKQEGTLSASGIQLTLLLAPAIVTCIVSVLSVHGKLKTMLNILPALASSALGMLLVIPLLPSGLRFELETEQVWQVLVKSQALVVGAGALVSLTFLWMQRGSFKHHDKRKKS
ncbi:MAG TPA: hypothetical protein VFB59_05180 [Candidatus Saccharimonadales bacterium]|nr:hypothetical protein [Candidatus Saccharimonadales bacterium]